MKWGTATKLSLPTAIFPAESIGKDAVVVRADGHSVPDMLDAILQLVPLDTYVENRWR